MATAIYETLQNVTVTTIVNLNLSGSITSLGTTKNVTPSVLRRKIPKSQDQIPADASLPIIVVAPGDHPIAINRFGTESTVNKDYPIDIAIIASGNLDLSSNNLGVYALWRETIENIFQQLPLNTFGLPTCIWDIRCFPDVQIDRRKLAEGYDYFVTRVIYRSIEKQA